MTIRLSKATKRRRQIREQHWPEEELWTGKDEKGWFASPRTLPLILSLLNLKAISENADLSSVYLELLSRQLDEGVVEMSHEKDHAYAAGYQGKRGVRTWQERMKILEERGFIKTVRVGDQQYKYVALIHPTAAIQRLKDNEPGVIPEHWWNAYCSRKAETQEATHAQREEARRLQLEIEEAQARAVEANRISSLALRRRRTVAAQQAVLISDQTKAEEG